MIAAVQGPVPGHHLRTNAMQCDAWAGWRPLPGHYGWRGRLVRWWQCSAQVTPAADRMLGMRKC